MTVGATYAFSIPWTVAAATPTPVPEPTPIALGLTGLVWLGLHRRRLAR